MKRRNIDRIAFIFTAGCRSDGWTKGTVISRSVDLLCGIVSKHL